MLGTSTTPYDLRFQLLGIPVRIHPMFWLIAAMLGWQDRNLPFVLLWVGCIFISILVHEFGHALLAKRFRGDPSVVLYGMGGLCHSEGERTKGERLAVILAGPAAGFLLCIAVMLLASLAFGIVPSEHFAVVQSLVGFTPNREDAISAIQKFGGFGNPFLFYTNMVWINLMWGLVNLLPIWPLDGGQATQIILSSLDPRQGIRRSHVISLLTAGALAIITWVLSHDYFLALFFGFFAFMNFQVLQAMHDKGFSGSAREDDWWRG